jgi:DNA-directed RNA polymerase subunit RPC12/RpoP
MEKDDRSENNADAKGCPRCGTELLREDVWDDMCEVSYDEKCPHCGYRNEVRVLGGPHWPDNGPLDRWESPDEILDRVCP